MSRIRRMVIAAAVSVLAIGAHAANAQDKLKIAFIPGIASDPFFLAMEKGARAAADKLGVELVWQGSASEYSPQSQMPFVDAALADDIDALILVPTDPDSLQPAVVRAEAAGIPVITVDTTVSDQAYLTAHITGDNVDGGRQAAKTLAEQIGGEGKVFIMSGSPGATTNTLREQGFREELASNFPKIEIVGREYANSQPANATSAVNTVLLNHPDLAGIFAIDGTSGTGTIAALRNNNAVGKVKLVGYDAYKAQVDALQEGVFTALVAQQPAKEAELALEYAKAKVTGEGADKIEKSVVIPNVVMTRENFAETGSSMYSE
ncbi:ABC transporter substrate-binding protein [Shinella yambaruensis]|uniref:D-ribose ABC transporter substrate-binding protein n=1 Tax=Shinella yambaruensis TaxID=415996 RepID=A0ABQ5ZWQ3_9HYPH|nr:ABC transporter substrate-binding protein [Shinella yambaruensis]MCJ8029160.1 ABC transporter substrate-binding protein [Shinella yambaruensis]MCU7983487.1 ABC transporter substrate-binding protein [Shinella yambaruensis]GLR55104.1 D-ribose ABC transporter substrate-binding protein [Shinella yambaruensis]